MDINKKYGLILSDKSKIKPPTFQATRNVFGNDTDSEDESKKKLVLLRPSDIINRQSKISQEKAINEDPTVYQYDEIYDSMTSKKEETKEKSKEQKKPKYIENLMKAANKRKIENERRLERQIQKEREKEGDEFADKEVFVTTAYKNKLEELRKEEEKEKYEEYLESIGDVTKQKDLGGFYRHLYEQKLGADKDEDKDLKVQSNDDVKANDEKSESKASDDRTQISKKRNYRKRKTSDHKNMSDSDIDDSDAEINRCNLEEIRLSKKYKQVDANIDADSDFSIDDSSDDEIDKNKKLEENSAKQKDTSKQDSPTEEKVEPITSDAKNEEIKSKPEAPVVKKIDIWKKRTVGEVFDQALKRYYERKANRGF